MVETVLVVSFMFAMTDRRDEIAQEWRRDYPSRLLCLFERDKLRERYTLGGQWSQSYRYFRVECK